MLKTNSKIVKQKIDNYIITSYHDATDCDDYNENATLDEIKNAIADDFRAFLGNNAKRINNSIRLEGGTIQSAFKNWCSGLPTRPNCDYYLGTAVDLVGDILEESETEKARFSQSDAEELMTYLLFKSLYNSIINTLEKWGW